MDNPETQATLGIQDIERRQPRDTGNIRHTRKNEDNPETLATLGIQNIERRQPRDTGNIRHTRYRTKTTQRHWQH